jgi:hypothetical protein
MSNEEAWEWLNFKYMYIGRSHVLLDKKTFFKKGFDARRMQLASRRLSKCQYCGLEFSVNELVRHKRERHTAEFAAKRAECLKIGQGWNRGQRLAS